jgi:hypothetical protein
LALVHQPQRSGLAAALSVFPGAGHLYAGQTANAVLWFIVVCTGYLFSIAVGFILHGFCALHAALGGDPMRETRGAETAILAVVGVCLVLLRLLLHDGGSEPKARLGHPRGADRASHASFPRSADQNSSPESERVQSTPGILSDIFASRSRGLLPFSSGRTLVLDKPGPGSGAVTSEPSGIACGSRCSHGYPPGTIVDLTAAEDPGSIFRGWSGACEGKGSCRVVMDANRVVTATFTKRPDQIGVYRPRTGYWYVDRDGDGKWGGCATDECRGPFGDRRDLPAVGNWTGLGTATLGVFRPGAGAWAFDMDRDGKWSGFDADGFVAPFGMKADRPVVGDWFGLGTDSIGVYRPSTGGWYLDTDANGIWDGCSVDECAFLFGQGIPGHAGDLPVVGDWTGSGTVSIGFFQSGDGSWFLDSIPNRVWDSGTPGDTYYSAFGMVGDQPAVGDWSGSGVTRIGVFRPSTGYWYLDTNGNGAWDGCSTDSCLGPFGIKGDIPVVGRW